MRFLHLRIRIKNTDSSIKFYRDNFGCEVVNQKTSPRGNKLTFLSLPGNDAVMELCEFPENKNKNFRIEDDLFHIAFGVKNMEETYKKMRKNGVKFTEGSSKDKMCFVEDPDGYEIELIEK